MRFRKAKCWDLREAGGALNATVFSPMTSLCCPLHCPIAFIADDDCYTSVHHPTRQRIPHPTANTPLTPLPTPPLSHSQHSPHPTANTPSPHSQHPLTPQPTPPHPTANTPLTPQPTPPSPHSQNPPSPHRQHSPHPTANTPLTPQPTPPSPHSQHPPHRTAVVWPERLKRFNQFKDQNTRRDSVYRYLSVNAWVERHFEFSLPLHIIIHRLSLSGFSITACNARKTDSSSRCYDRSPLTTRASG